MLALGGRAAAPAEGRRASTESGQPRPTSLPQRRAGRWAVWEGRAAAVGDHSEAHPQGLRQEAREEGHGGHAVHLERPGGGVRLAHRGLRIEIRHRPRADAPGPPALRRARRRRPPRLRGARRLLRRQGGGAARGRVAVGRERACGRVRGAREDAGRRRGLHRLGGLRQARVRRGASAREQGGHAAPPSRHLVGERREMGLGQRPGRHQVGGGVPHRRQRVASLPRAHLVCARRDRARLHGGARGDPRRGRRPSTASATRAYARSATALQLPARPRPPADPGDSRREARHQGGRGPRCSGPQGRMARAVPARIRRPAPRPRPRRGGASARGLRAGGGLRRRGAQLEGPGRRARPGGRGRGGHPRRSRGRAPSAS